MTFTELVAAVYEITNRPDKVALTESAVRSATLFSHHKDFFLKDIFEIGVDFGADSYIQQLDFRAVLPRYRSLSYLRKYDPSSGAVGKFLKPLQPGEVFDQYGYQKKDICYVAGSNININSCNPQRYYIWGSYLHPDVTTSGFTSWVAIDHPYAIVFRAAGTVFKSIGKDEEAAANKVLADEQLALVEISNVIAEGY